MDYKLIMENVNFKEIRNILWAYYKHKAYISKKRKLMQSWKHHSLGMYLNFKIIMLVYYSQFVLLGSVCKKVIGRTNGKKHFSLLLREKECRIRLNFNLINKAIFICKLIRLYPLHKIQILHIIFLTRSQWSIGSESWVLISSSYSSSFSLSDHIFYYSARMHHRSQAFCAKEKGLVFSGAVAGWENISFAYTKSTSIQQSDPMESRRHSM